MRFPQVNAVVLVIFSLIGSGSAIAEERRVNIEIHPASDSEWDGMTAYGFGVSLAAWVAENEDLDTLPAGLYVPTFAALRAAYELQIQLWRKLIESENIQHRYAGELIAVSDAEFLDEYIWHFYRSEDWGDPGPNVDMAAFLKWADANLRENHPRQDARLVIVDE